MEDQVKRTPEGAPAMPLPNTKGSMPDFTPNRAPTTSMAKEKTTEAELEIPPKGFKSLSESSHIEHPTRLFPHHKET